MSMGEDPKPQAHRYAHAHDEEAQRTRYELWAILAVVVVVIVGGLIWRAVTGTHAAPQKGWSPTEANTSGPPATAAAGAGIPPRGVGATGVPRPAPVSP